ncbi:hypothetical protein [Nitrolancea hollandica]|uniref:Peptidase M41 domain-containing protein n=1 Tax=Nitrolancea hollandica Lb TaxID=1129897 RepID=I4EIF1_9BACT|nr:hypothetical protein [Nitrolancea hollandica]CCF84463.1 hypothetical protein NITHO_3430008 [Nitrolancea hollandica Lb]
MSAERPGALPQRKDHTAYHEAGHAVAAFVLGRGFYSVSITSEGNSAGRCYFAPRPEMFNPWSRDPATQSRLEIEVITDLAGGIAERIATGFDNVPGMASDVYSAIDTATYITGNEAKRLAYIERAEARAESILRQHWRAVQALAEALLRLGEIDYPLARAIIESSRSG